MNPSQAPTDHSRAGNGPSHTMGGAGMPASTPQSTTAMPPAWPPQMAESPANNGAASSPGFPQYSASTAAILQRLQEKGGHASGSAAFEAKKAEILQNYATSDKLPTPPPAANNGRKGRGGRLSAASGLKTEVGASPVGVPSGRGAGRGRGRGRGRGGRGGRGVRGGKRKRNESDEDDENDDDSDVSDSHTLLPTHTKSGRSVNKPVAFVPTIPEPSQGVKRKKSAKTMLAAKCKTCHRQTDPTSNRIVFCDACSTAYHQYCHDPPIENEVVTVFEKEWLCAPCMRSKLSTVPNAQSLVSAANLTIDEKRAYFSTLSQHKLADLLLTASIRHPELPIFPPNIQQLVPQISTIIPQALPAQLPQNPSQSAPPPPKDVPTSTTQPPNGSTHTPPSQTFPISDLNSLEAQLLETSSQQAQPPRTTMDLAGNQYDEDDGYDTDPPAHYPKPGNGLARTLRPESEDLNWLVDDNFEVFSHGWKGDGTGMGADGVLDGVAGSGTKMV